MIARLLTARTRRRQAQRVLHTRAVNGLCWMRQTGETDAQLLARANATFSDRELAAQRNFGTKTVAYVRAGRYVDWNGMAN